MTLRRQTFFILTILVALCCTVPVSTDAASVKDIEIWGARGSEPGRFDEPRDIAVDSQGNVYVADFRNYRIQKLDRKGKFITAWGQKGEKDGEFQDPCGVAIGPKGHVYIADTWNHRIQRFSNDGKWLASYTAGLFAPRGVDVDKQGFIYVADTGGARIVVMDEKGNYIRSFGQRGPNLGQFNEPTSVCLDATGNIYVHDSANHRLQIFTNNSQFIKQLVLGDGSKPADESYCEVGPNGYIFATYPSDDVIYVFDKEYNKVKVFGGFGRGKGQFEKPSGIGIGPDGAVYVADRWNHRLQKLNLEIIKSLPEPVISQAAPQQAPFEQPPAQQPQAQQEFQAPPQSQPFVVPTQTGGQRGPQDLFTVILGLVCAIITVFVLSFIGVKLSDRWRAKKAETPNKRDKDKKPPPPPPPASTGSTGPAPPVDSASGSDGQTQAMSSVDDGDEFFLPQILKKNPYLTLP